MADLLPTGSLTPSFTEPHPILMLTDTLPSLLTSLSSRSKGTTDSDPSSLGLALVDRHNITINI